MTEDLWQMNNDRWPMMIEAADADVDAEQMRRWAESNADDDTEEMRR